MLLSAKIVSVIFFHEFHKQTSLKYILFTGPTGSMHDKHGRHSSPGKAEGYYAEDIAHQERLRVVMLKT